MKKKVLNIIRRVFGLHTLRSRIDEIATQSSIEISQLRNEISNLRSGMTASIENSEKKEMTTDRSIIDSYISKSKTKKLHIGCGENVIDGWLNTDFEPTTDGVLFIDACDTFPFEDDVFEFIFSEHMIEHIAYPSGLRMLSECHRVMKDNGKIRISTPDLQFLIDLYNKDKTELQSGYIKWATETTIEYAPYPEDIFVINNFVRDWGHLFIYDEKTLRASLTRAGFTNIVKCKLNESESDVFRGLENEKRMPPGFLALESITLEGTKTA